MYRRTLHAHSGHHALQDAFNSLLMTEFVYPSKEIYLFIERLSDVPLLDNRLELFSDLFPQVSRRLVYLSDILLTLALKGSSIRVLCNPDIPQTKSFIEELNGKLEIRRLLDHPPEGLFTERLHIRGTLQFADRGIYVERENVYTVFEPNEVLKQLDEVRKHWEEAK